MPLVKPCCAVFRTNSSSMWRNQGEILCNTRRGNSTNSGCSGVSASSTIQQNNGQGKQFSLLAETLAHERQDIQIHKKAQEKALQNMKRELRNKMEKEIGELQKVIIQNDENNYFRDLDVERLQKRVQMASFQYPTSCLQ